MNKSESIANLAKALAAAQGEMGAAIKHGKANYGKYAKLEDVWEAASEPLTKNGLSLIQFPTMIGDKPALETIILHISGEWISNSICLNPVKNDPQTMGGAITYYRRYGMAAALGITQEDDDGNKASGKLLTQPMPAPKSVPIPTMTGPIDGNWVIPFGKFKGKKMTDIDVGELVQYRDYIVQKAREDSKPITGVVSTFVEEVDRLEQLMNQGGQEEGDFARF